MNSNTRRLASLAMLAAIAYVVMLATGLRFMPDASFLKYEAKDVIIAMAGFIHGPLAAFGVACTVALLELVTVSETGPIGFLMNVLSASAFACTAALVYKRRRSVSGAVIGLFAGAAAMVAMMLLWNYIVTPVYMNVPRPVVAGMLVPVFLPFNLVKAGLNASLSLLLYKPLVRALRAARLAPPSNAAALERPRVGWGLLAVSLALLVTCVAVVALRFGFAETLASALGGAGG